MKNRSFLILSGFFILLILSCSDPSNTDETQDNSYGNTEEESLFESYKNFEIDLSSETPQSTNDYYNYYVFDDYIVYEYTSGNLYTIFDNGLEISMLASGSWSFYFPSGRQCKYYPSSNNVYWSLLMDEFVDFSLPLLSDSETIVRLSDYQGSVILLDFWASWCGPCINYLPDTQDIYEEYADQGLVVLGINIEGNTVNAADTVSQLGLTFPVLMGNPNDSGIYNWDCEQLSQYNINSIPRAILIDKDGIVRADSTVISESTIETWLNQ